MMHHILAPDFYCIDPRPKNIVVGFICSYVLVSGNEAVVIEPGPDSGAENVVEELKKLGLADMVKYVIATHIHLDHGGGLGRMLQLLPKAVGLVHPRAVKHLIDPTKLWKASRAALGWLGEVYGKPTPAPPDRLLGVEDGQEFRLGDLTLRIVHTVGHASHHISIYVPERRLLFTGDSAGIYLKEIDKVVPTTMPPFRFDPYVESIEKQIKLDPETLAYTHTWIAGNGRSRLEKHKEHVLKLLDDVIEGLKAGVGREGLLEFLAKRDDDIRHILSYIKGNDVLNLLVELAIEGLYLEAEERLKVVHSG